MKHSRWLSLVLFLVAGSAQAGTLYFSEDSNPMGLHSLDVTSGAATFVGASGVTSETVGLAADVFAEILYGTTFSNTTTIAPDGSGSTIVGGAQAEGLTYDPDGGKLYGAFNTAFFEISTADFTTTVPLADPGNDIEGLAYAGGGIIYGLSSFSGPRGVLYSYDIDLDSWTEIGFTGVEFTQAGLAYDDELGLLYAKGDQDSLLYSIDPVTGLASVIGDTGLAAGGGLAFFGDPSAVSAPGTLALAGLLLAGLALSLLSASPGCRRSQAPCRARAGWSP